MGEIHKISELDAIEWRLLSNIVKPERSMTASPVPNM
jgi:hypothetical protein